jgi:hypothetical protein
VRGGARKIARLAERTLQALEPDPSAVKITDAGCPEVGWIGSRVSVNRRPLSVKSFFQLSSVRKYQGAGSENSSLKPAHDP